MKSWKESNIGNGGETITYVGKKVDICQNSRSGGKMSKYLSANIYVSYFEQ